MTAQKGRDMLLKVDGVGDGTFTTVAGLRARGIVLNASSVDSTSADSDGGWRELLGAGVRSARLSGTGLFRDTAADELVRGVFFGSHVRNWQIMIPDFGVVQGAFQLTALEYAGDHDGEMTYQMTLESAGALTFTAATNG